MAGSIQHKLSRVRPPRVQITYDVEIGNAIVMKELPFVMGILADLSAQSAETLPKVKERKFVYIDRDNFNDVLKSYAPHLSLKVKDTLSSQEDASTTVDLSFTSLEDFEPLNLIHQIPALETLYTNRLYLNDLMSTLEGNDALEDFLTQMLLDSDILKNIKEELTPEGNKTQTPDTSNPDKPTKKGRKSDPTLERLFKEGKLARLHTQEPLARNILKEFITRVEAAAEDFLPIPKNIVAFIHREIQETDEKISDQLNEIMHAQDFLKLEGSWRGLHYLVMNTETSTSLKLRLLNISKKELLEDLDKAVEFDQSALFKKVYEEEYGTFGGNPYSCLVGDFEFSRDPQDMELLNKLAEVAAAAHTPFIAASSPHLFNLDSFSQLGAPRDLSKIFESSEMVQWRSFRELEDSRYVALTLPRALMRLPYGPKTLPVEGLNFQEKVNGTDNSKFCWGNAAYLLGQRITNAFALYKWTTAIRGVEGGGLVENLPAYTFTTTDGDSALKCPTEISITDRREKELSDMGFIALCHCKGSDKASFFGAQTTQAPIKYNTDDATANAELSARLTYILAASRFAHYIKAIMRDKVGSFMSKDDVQKYLNTWIANYVLLSDDATQGMKAKYPLREARIDVLDNPSHPGYYKAVIFLRPHFQLEGLTTSLRLVANIPQGDVTDPDGSGA